MKYPNLELIEYIFKEKVERHFDFGDGMRKNFTCTILQMFPQAWATTATGFDWGNVCSGQAFTDKYTTVIRLGWWYKDKDTNTWEISFEKMYGVFFGDRLAYICYNPNKKFEEDLGKLCMKSQRESIAYLGENENSEIIIFGKNDCPIRYKNS